MAERALTIEERLAVLERRVTWVPLLWGYVIADILIKVFDL